MKRRQILAGMALAPFAALAAPRGAANDPAGPRTRPFPNVILRTHENRAARFYDDLIRGNRIVAINLMYAQCGGVCPLTTANLARVQRALGERAGRDVFIYSITVQPKTDTPAVLKAYARAFGAGPGWLFLTGRQKDIEMVRRRLGLVDPDPDLDGRKDTHTGMLVFGNDAIDRWAACPALSDPKLIVRSLMWMKGPAQAG